MELNEKWQAHHFDERQRKEIAFSRLYARQFGHGTDGHNAKLIIAKMADLLDQNYDGQPESEGQTQG